MQLLIFLKILNNHKWSNLTTLKHTNMKKLTTIAAIALLASCSKKDNQSMTTPKMPVETYIESVSREGIVVDISKTYKFKAE